MSVNNFSLSDIKLSFLIFLRFSILINLSHWDKSESESGSNSFFLEPKSSYSSVMKNAFLFFDFIKARSYSFLYKLNLIPLNINIIILLRYFYCFISDRIFNKAHLSLTKLHKVLSY